MPSLRDCLEKQSEFVKFHQFATALKCEENVEFVQAVSGLRALTDEAQIQAHARAIYDEVRS